MRSSAPFINISRDEYRQIDGQIIPTKMKKIITMTRLLDEFEVWCGSKKHEMIRPKLVCFSFKINYLLWLKTIATCQIRLISLNTSKLYMKPWDGMVPSAMMPLPKASLPWKWWLMMHQYGENSKVRYD